MKTSLFKWSKDPLLASGYYEQAGTCVYVRVPVSALACRAGLMWRCPAGAAALLFHASKNVDMRIQALLKASACQEAVRVFAATVLGCLPACRALNGIRARTCAGWRTRVGTD